MYFVCTVYVMCLLRYNTTNNYSYPVALLRLSSSTSSTSSTLSTSSTSSSDLCVSNTKSSCKVHVVPNLTFVYYYDLHDGGGAIRRSHAIMIGEEPLHHTPNPYIVFPCRFKAYTMSWEVTVFRLACTVYTTASLIKFSRNFFKTPRVSS